MVKKIMMSLLLGGFLNVGDSFAMQSVNPEPKKQETRELTSSEKENAHKMFLLQEHMKNMAAEQKDIHGQIGKKLHEVSTNPVLAGELVYSPNEGKPETFKIRDLVKEDGSLDLSNRDNFGDASVHLLITTDPEKFFNINRYSPRLIVLIAPRFLIKAKLETTASPFKPIMDKWKEEQAPIGIFWRMEKWEALEWYDHLTSENLVTISKNDLYENRKIGSNRDLSYSFFPLRALLNFHVRFE